MHPETIEIQRKKLFAVIASPNIEADDLETHLGIKFPRKPEKYLMQGHNRLAFVLNLLIPGNTSFELLLFTFSKHKDSAAQYLSDYHAVVIFENQTSNAHHENMHGYIHCINPSLSRTIVEAHEAISEAKMRRKPVPTDVSELMWASRCFDEGLAEWGTVTTDYRMGDGYRLLAIARHNFLTGFSGMQNSDHMRPAGRSFLAKIFGLLDNAIETGRDNDMTQYFVPYSLGYHFACVAISELTASSLIIPEALDLLIKNPPRSLQSLRNPSRFARELLG